MYSKGGALIPANSEFSLCLGRRFFEALKSGTVMSYVADYSRLGAAALPLFFLLTGMYYNNPL